MIPVPKLAGSSKKMELYTQSQGAGPPIIRSAGSTTSSTSVQSRPKNPNAATAPSIAVSLPPSASVGMLTIPGPGHKSKGSVGKLAEFFGVDKEGDVGQLLTNMGDKRASASEYLGIPGGPHDNSDTGSEKSNRNSGMAEEDDEEDDLEPHQKRQSNTPKRAAKLAKFFGVPNSENEIGKIRSELRLASKMNHYRGCIGENIVKIEIGASQFASSKTLLISDATTAEDCIKILLAKLGIDREPSKYVILEISADKSQRPLRPDECPLQVMAKWTEKKTFLLKKAKVAVADDDDEDTGVVILSLPFSGSLILTPAIFVDEARSQNGQARRILWR